MDKSILNNSVTGREFLANGCPTKPGIDEMLDWRKHLTELRSRSKQKWHRKAYDIEIKGVDEILKYLNVKSRSQYPGSKSN